jgi:hypothetical protein
MKVFGIGMPRTGTTSLTAALDTLGFTPALHNPYDVEAIARCGSATDLTIAWRFKPLALSWPEAKFIYTSRDVGPWLASIERHYVKHYMDVEALGPADPLYHPQWFQGEAIIQAFGQFRPRGREFLAGRRRHESTMRRFFRRQPGRLLEIDITADVPDTEKWGPICAFLDVPVPDLPFPRLNQYQG